MKLNKEKGFTLIELLVVIAIIGVLSTLAVVSLNNARQKSRDSKRVGDVKQMQNAMELYYNDANGYPQASAVAAGAAIQFGTTKYMNQVPTAPTQLDTPCTAANIAYIYNTVGPSALGSDGATPVYTSYTLTYCLGGETGGIAANVHTATPGGMTQ